MACTTANVSFKSALTEDDLIHALVTGKVPAKRVPHLRTLFDEAPVALLRGLVDEAAGWEKKFGQWENLPADGRRYWLDVLGRQGWRARYLKEVDADEHTLRFWQEIYDEHGILVEIHQKYPVDTGHQKA